MPDALCFMMGIVQVFSTTWSIEYLSVQECDATKA